LGSSFEGSNSRGITQIVDYLKKCIKRSSEKKAALPNRFVESDDEEMEFEDHAEDTKIMEAKEATKKRKDTDVVPLQRPIIFICNDIYARALAPLKEIALSVKIEEANREKLVSRLREICKN
jgi:hypothetical protein